LAETTSYTNAHLLLHILHGEELHDTFLRELDEGSGAAEVKSPPVPSCNSLNFVNGIYITYKCLHQLLSRNSYETSILS